MTGIGNMKKKSIKVKKKKSNCKIRNIQDQNQKSGTRINKYATVGNVGYIVDSAEVEERVGDGEEKSIERQPVA